MLTENKVYKIAKECGAAELNYWERLFILKLGGRIVMVKRASVSNVRQNENDEIFAYVEPYYKVNDPPPKGGELRFVPSTPSLA